VYLNQGWPFLLHNFHNTRKGRIDNIHSSRTYRS
jgi:hypothetical protein